MTAAPTAVTRRWARVTTSFEGLHCYPGAPQEVAFLRSLHRHVFVVNAWVEQFDDERDVEYILLKRWLGKQIATAPFEESVSCEQMARSLGISLVREYPGRRVKVEVTEDGENGAVLEFDEPCATPAE